MPSLTEFLGGTAGFNAFVKIRVLSSQLSHSNVLSSLELCVDKLRELHGDDVEMIFVGDKNIPGGNDWSLAQRLETIEGSQWYQVLCPEETRSLIEYGELFI